MSLSPLLILLLIPLPAIGAFVLLGLGPTRIPRSQVKALALLGGIGPLLPMTAAFALCLSGACTGVQPIFTLEVGEAEVALALMLDPLSALVGLVVTAIGACVLTYSIGYLGHAQMVDLRRFLALMTLFLASMLTMVLAGDSITFFLGWELMGLCSFFLIAHRVESSQAIAAGRKAFIITRVADAFLLAALLLLFLEAGSVRLETLIPAGAAMDAQLRTLIAVLLLLGALGKSAQFPFHTWLPTAMAGPTPVSALLHSATMVAAGAFLLARFAPMFEAAPGVMAATALMGALTAAFGALTAVFQQDVKRLLAWSSVSQIGFMIMSIGLGAPEAAVAHFTVHAIFKSLLFLSAGDITHGRPEGTDIWAMRGAWRRRPLAYAGFVAGAASLAGLPLITAGWWSKEAMFAAAWTAGPLGQALWAVGLGAAVLTGTYAFRPVLVGLAPVARPVTGFGGPFIAIPLALLGVGALAAGFAVDPIVHFLGAEVPHLPAYAEGLGAAAPLLGLTAAAVLTYVPRAVLWLEGSRRMRRGARIDGLWQAVFVRPFVGLVRRLNGLRGGWEDPVGSFPVVMVVRAQEAATARLLNDPIDRVWIGSARGLFALWTGLRRAQSGQVRLYALALALGVAALGFLAWGTSWR